MAKSTIRLGGAVLVCGLFCILGSQAPRPSAAQAVCRDRVVFISNRQDRKRFDLYQMHGDGSNLASLGAGTTPQFDPAWSPDGTRIAFSAGDDVRQRKVGLYVLEVAGGVRKQIVPGADMALSPAWSPDGREIAFTRIEYPLVGSPRCDVYIVQADGTRPRKLTGGMFPSWSRDGRVLLTALDLGGEEEPRLLIADAQTGATRPVGEKRSMMGVWSPDGRQIAYSGEGGGEQPDIFVMNADGTNRTRITRSADHELAPQWSTDGKRIYFNRLSRTRPDRASIWVSDVEGKKAEQLTRSDGADLIGSGGLFWGFGSATSR